MEVTEKKENMSLGILGALIGGLIGGASIILFEQMGMVSALSGVILAFCTLKGYELLGGKLSKRSVWVCIVVMLIVPYFADRVNWALVIMEAYGWLFGDSFLFVHNTVEAEGLQTDYWKDLGFIYAFTALGAFTILQPMFKKKED